MLLLGEGNPFSAAVPFSLLLPCFHHEYFDRYRFDMCSLDVPQFLLSTKFFACLELDDSRKVAEATTTLTLEPHSILFNAGDDGSSGIFVVVEGCLGMFLPDGDGLAQTNTLMPGESVGDLDVIDGVLSLLARLACLLVK